MDSGIKIYEACTNLSRADVSKAENSLTVASMASPSFTASSLFGAYNINMELKSQNINKLQIQCRSCKNISYLNVKGKYRVMK